MICEVCENPSRKAYGRICRKCKAMLKRECAARMAELPWYIVPDRKEIGMRPHKEKRLYAPTRIPSKSWKHPM